MRLLLNFSGSCRRCFSSACRTAALSVAFSSTASGESTIENLNLAII